jgi:carbamoyltransferase
MIRWGITAGAHDASLTVFDGYDIKFAAHAERSSGIKNDRDLNQTLINQALEYGEPWAVHWYETSWLKRLRQLRAKQYKTAFLRHGPKSQLARFGFDAMLVPPDDATQSMMKDVKFYNHRHHHTHAAAGYYTSPFSSAAVLVVDSIGEFETLTIWDGHGNNLKRVYSQGYPDSVGLWYSAMTQRIGLKPNEEEYILMGWAALGDPYKYKKRILDDFVLTMSDGIKFKHNLHRGCLWWAPELNTLQDFADIAAATQSIYEDMFETLVLKTQALTGQKNLVIMGGCALNCVANSIAYKYFDNVWVMPNPGDAGSSLGAVAAHHGKHLEWTGPYLGYNIKGKYPKDAIIKELQNTGIVGVANGRAEFGPRALGNRSLLADPRGGDVKERVNAIKQRQEFRPFAPVIMEDFVDEYFDGVTGPYMQFTAKCKYPEKFPAIVHLDGTSRVQTVNRKQHPGLYATLKHWQELTGCPMLLNTSLNIKGKPMVDTEADAKNWQQEYGVKVV